MKKSPKKSLLFVGIGIIALSLVYFATRIFNLTIIPIFTDEAIYLRWAQIALGDPRWRFISLLDGKQPLFIWLMLPVLKLVADPLVAGRLLSVAMGYVAMIGFMAFSWYLTRKLLVSLVAGLVYICFPFFLVYDRLAIYEALFLAIAVWTIFLMYIYGTKQRLDVALILGTVIGVGLLTKSYANYYLILLPITLLLITWKKSEWKSQFMRWLGLSFVVLIQSQIYSNILRLSEFRHVVDQKNLSFIYSFGEILQDPFKSVVGNSIGLANWLIGYLSLPLFITIIFAFFWYIRKSWKTGLFFLSFFIVPFVSLAFFGRVIYPRFLLFMIPPLLIPTFLFFSYLYQKYSIKILFGGFFLLALPLFFSFKLLTDPIHAPLPQADRQQFINDWPSGYGIPEVVDYLDQEAKNGPIIVGTEGTFGLFPMALEVFLGKNNNITFKAYWPLNEFPTELEILAQKQPVFLIFKERQVFPEGQYWPIELIKQYQRGDGPTYLKFYRVLPKS